MTIQVIINLELIFFITRKRITILMQCFISSYWLYNELRIEKIRILEYTDPCKCGIIDFNFHYKKIHGSCNKNSPQVLKERNLSLKFLLCCNQLASHRKFLMPTKYHFFSTLTLEICVQNFYSL